MRLVKGLILSVIMMAVLGIDLRSQAVETSSLDDLIAQMTIEEKVAILSGTNLWYTHAIERLGIPAVKMTDGPNGARGSAMRGGPDAPTSACFPAGIALAATWNTELVRQVGRAIAEEAKTKGARVLLAPTVNIQRTPLGGRNFECYSEDPYLTSRMAVAFIQGVQSQGVAAVIKHFVANDSEFERHTISSEVRERVLREIYLPPFKAAVQEAGVMGVMAAYNRLNDTYCSENRWLLQEVLRKEWGFDGLVISDWGATHSTVEALEAGLDLEMPGANFRGEKLLQAVREGKVDEATLDEHVRRVLQVH
jgi:beta-glucosidase